MAKKIKSTETPPQRVIDIHVHLFNAHYIPIAGVARQYPIEFNFRFGKFLGNLVELITEWIAEEFEELANCKTDIDNGLGPLEKDECKPSEERERKLLNLVEWVLDNCREKKGDIDFLDMIHKKPQILNELQHSIDNKENPSVIKKYQLGELLNCGTIICSEKKIYSETEFKNSAKSEEQSIYFNAKKYWKNFICDLIRDMPVFEWVSALMKTEYDIFKHMTQNFYDKELEESKEAKKFEYDIKLFINLDMDMENWYTEDNAKPPLIRYAEPNEKNGVKKYKVGKAQKRMEKLSNDVNYTKGEVINFFAFDPLRNDFNTKEGQRGEHSLELAKNALEKMNYLGVKYYPPNGFRPFFNKQPSSKFEKRKNSYFKYSDVNFPKQLMKQKHREYFDEVNDALFEYCNNNGIPILTHCNNGGAMAYENAGWNTDPRFWEKVLEKYSDLRVCFGHAGSPRYWKTKLDDAQKKLFECYYYLYYDTQVDFPKYCTSSKNYKRFYKQFNEWKRNSRIWKRRILRPVLLDIVNEKRKKKGKKERKYPSRHDYYTWEKSALAYSFGKKVHELCVKYKNVYTEFGHNEEIFESDHKHDHEDYENHVEHFSKRILELIEHDRRNHEKINIGEKLMFGSDYHLLLTEGHGECFIHGLLNAFTEINKESKVDWKDKFFYKNAVNFLNFEGYRKRVENNSNVDNIIAHLRKLGIINGAIAHQ